MRQLAIALVILVWPSGGLADVARVLALCLDTSLTPETRISALRNDGWQETGDPVEALAVALTLMRLNSGVPETWEEVRNGARSSAARAEGEAVFLRAPRGINGVFIGRERSGLQTCLYLGETLDMVPLQAALDGSILRKIGEVSRIRGDGVKSLISAHGMTEAGQRVFAPPLAYAMSFSVVLDRQPGDVR